MIRGLFLEYLSLWGCVWQSTLFAVIGLAGSFLLRRRPARASQVLFLAIIAAVLLPTMSVLVRHFGLGLFTEEPIAFPSFITETPAESLGISLAPEIQPAALEVPTDFALAESGSEDVRIPWRLIALYGWMIATLILLGRLFAAFVSGIRLLRRAQSDGCEHIRGAANAARARLGITKGLQIRSSEEIRSPMIWCWSRPPVLLVPGDLDGRVDWVGVICHELAHWRRWDHVSGLAAELAVCILPWNPLLWWSKKRMVRLSEQACDDWVLAGGRAGADYAQSLLNLSPELQMAFMPTVIGKEKPMKERICRIVKEKCGIPRVGVRWALVVTLIAASAMVGVALAQRRPARLEPPQRDQRPAAEERERQVLTERMADLKGQAHELKARMDEVRTELAKLEDSGDGEGDRARALRAELRELEETMAPIERELQGLEGEQRQREARQLQGGQEPPREILRRLEELGRETELVLQSLADQQLGGNEEANVLYGRMRELNEQMQQVRRQLGQRLEGPGRQRRELDVLDRERERSRPIREFGLEAHSQEMILQMEGLRQKARQMELELEQLGGENPERAEKLHAGLRAIHDAIAQTEREIGSLRVREAMPEVSLRELQEQAQIIERRLQELRDNNPEETQELRVQLDQIRRQIQRIEREPDRFQRPFSLVEDPMQPGTELRQSEPGGLQEPGRDDLEREVRDLRKQIDSVNEQMGEMRELMKRLLEKGEPSEAQ